MQPSEADQLQFVTKHVVPSPPEWRAVIEEFLFRGEQRLVAHIQFYKFTPSVFRAYRAWWQLFRSAVTAPLYAHSSTDDAKFERWCRLSGFVPLQEAICNDGQTRRIFIHTIQGNSSDREHVHTK